MHRSSTRATASTTALVHLDCDSIPMGGGAPFLDLLVDRSARIAEQRPEIVRHGGAEVRHAVRQQGRPTSTCATQVLELGLHACRAAMVSASTHRIRRHRAAVRCDAQDLLHGGLRLAAGAFPAGVRAGSSTVCSSTLAECREAALVVQLLVAVLLGELTQM